MPLNGENNIVCLMNIYIHVHEYIYIYIYIIKTLHFVPDVSAEHSLSQRKILFSLRQAVFSRNVRNKR